MDELAYFSDMSQAPSRSCSCANSSCTHFALRICFGWVEKRTTSKSVPNKDICSRDGGPDSALARFHSHPHYTHTMSFQDIESGQGQPLSSQPQTPQSREEAAFLNLQSSLSLRVFKINANVQEFSSSLTSYELPGIHPHYERACVSPRLLIRQCGSVLMAPASHDLTETTRAMTKHGSDDLKKLAALQATLVRCALHASYTCAQY